MNNVGRCQFSLAGLCVLTAAVAVGLWVYLQIRSLPSSGDTEVMWWGVVLFASVLGLGGFAAWAQE